MGQKFEKFKKSKFQYQSLKNIFFQYAPMPHGPLGGMAPSLGTTALKLLRYQDNSYQKWYIQSNMKSRI